MRRARNTHDGAHNLLFTLETYKNLKRHTHTRPYTLHLQRTPTSENTEGEYSGLEHEVVDGVVESLKVITHEKSLRVAEYAFEFAFLNNRRRVTAVHKANIMKKGDGMFLKACKEVAARYPTVEYTEMIGARVRVELR